MRKIVYCLVNIVFLVLIISDTNAKQCGDPECKKPILLGEATIKYGPSDGYRIAFAHGEKVEILARSVGKDNGYWIKNEKGEVGYAHREAIRESKVVIPSAERIEVEDSLVLQATPTQKPEVIDGTTFYESVPASTVSSDKVVDVTEPTTVTETPMLQMPSEVVQKDKPEVVETLAKEGEADEENEEDDDEDTEDGEGDDDDEDENDMKEEENSKNDSKVEEVIVPEGVLKQEDKKEEVKIEPKVEEPVVESQKLKVKDELLKSQEAANVPIQELLNTEKPIEITTEIPIPNNIKIEEPKIVQTAEALSKNVQETDIQQPKIVEEPVKAEEPAKVEEPAEVEEMAKAEEPAKVEEPTKIEEATKLEEPAKVEEIVKVEELVTKPEISKAEPQKAETPELKPEILEMKPEILKESIIKETKADIPEFKPIAEEVPIFNAPELKIEQPKEPIKKIDVLSPIIMEKETNENESFSSTTPTPQLQEDIPPLFEATEPVTQIPPIIIPVHEEPNEKHHHHHHIHKKIIDPINILGHGGILTPKPPFRTLQQLHKHEPQHVDPEIRNLLMNNDEIRRAHSGEKVHHEDHTLSLQKDTDQEQSYCETNSCPPSSVKEQHQQTNGFHHPLAAGQKSNYHQSEESSTEFNAKMDENQMKNNGSEEETVDYVDLLITKMFEMTDLIVYLTLTSLTLLVFMLGNSCINRNRKEKPLIYKINLIERDLMTYQKENAVLLADLRDTKEKLTSIEDNSFGSDDQILLLREELEQKEEQINSLEKELETAAEAGLELNRMVAELLNQSGSDSIAMTVDELQRQLNEQQDTIITMNMALAEKSRENSELQIKLSDLNEQFNEEVEQLQQNFNDLKLEKSNLEIELKSIRDSYETKVHEFTQKNSSEHGRLCNELKAYQSKYEDTKKHLTTSEARIEALEDCIKDMKKGNSGGTAENIIDSAELKADLLVLNKEKANLQDRLHGEIIARQLLDDHVKLVNDEISNLKKDYSKAEKEKLEAETRLDVLSSYFKEKETTLQKELREKEALWMKSQGETTSTVERVRTMQDEIQTLKSQNEALRAEIEAQATAHKAQNAALENRAHEAWLSARQAERKYEECRNEAGFLRRKLTTMGDTTTAMLPPNPIIDGNDTSLQAPSPIRVESPKSPLMGPLPPHPFLPPPPFMAGPPFMPFVPPPDEMRSMRPAPLGGRLMSPPPLNRYSPDHLEADNRDRYSPNHHGRFSPDSRFDDDHRYNDDRRGYYETETDFSPPPSPMRRPNYTRDRDFDKRDRGREREYDDRDREREREREREHPPRDGGYTKPYSPTIPRTTKNYNKGGFNSSESQDSIVSPKKGGKHNKLST